MAIPKSLAGYDLVASTSTKAPKTVLKKRQSLSSSTSPSTVSSTPSPKRRRRAPSPVRWVPASLTQFDMFPIECTQSTPIPLLPVTPYQDPRSSEWIEERDSYDENVGVNPYHPRYWKGKLPGPGLMLGGKSVMNLNLNVGYGGRSDADRYIMGRLLLT